MWHSHRAYWHFMSLELCCRTSIRSWLGQIPQFYDWLPRTCHYSIIVKHCTHIDDFRMYLYGLQMVQVNFLSLEICLRIVRDRVRNMENLQRIVSTCNERIRCWWEVVVWVLSSPAKVVDIVWLSELELAPVKLPRLSSCTEYDRLSFKIAFWIGNSITCTDLFDGVEISILNCCLLLLLYLLHPFCLSVSNFNFATINLLSHILFFLFLNGRIWLSGTIFYVLLDLIGLLFPFLFLGTTRAHFYKFTIILIKD